MVDGEAVAMESGYGKGCIMAKIDLKAAFRMHGVHCSRGVGPPGGVLERQVLR